MRHFATVALATILSFASYAQHNHNFCASDYVFELDAAKNPQMLVERQQQIDDYLEDPNPSYVDPETGVRVIPVVFHVVYYNFQDSITIAQCQSGLDVVNDDYNLLNSDAGNVRAQFASVQTNMEFEFRLAKIDPNGAATTGVTYHQNDQSLAAGTGMRANYNWPNEKYLNIWVVRAIDVGLDPSQGTVLGFAAFPTNNQSGSADGIVIRHDQLGLIGTSVSIGRTLTHEMGHWLNLFHPFNFGCSNGGDLVGDTPPVSGPSHGCDWNKTSCGQTTMIENYMDYADDVCTNTFTVGQKTRANTAMNNTNWKRGILAGTTNLAATGVDGNPITATPTANFKVDYQTVCAGSAMDFINLSVNYTGAATYNWTFTNMSTGAQTTSTDENPSITFAQDGFYNVKLTTTNSEGSSTMTKQNYIKVVSPSIYNNHFTATFENALPNVTWQVFDDGDGRTWQTTNLASVGGNRSIMVPTFQTKANGIDYLQSAPIKLDQTTFATLNFNYAWARVENSNQDRLNVEVSTDCGQTWQVVRLISSFNLNTAGGNVTSNFVPNASQWKNVSISLNSYVGPDPIMIRFAYTSNGGNNLYLDEITTDVSVGIIEEASAKLLVYPNPASEDLHIALTSGSDASYSLTNLNGQTIMNGELTNGETNLNVAHLAKGIYILQVTSNGVSKTERVVLQ